MTNNETSRIGPCANEGESHPSPSAVLDWWGSSCDECANATPDSVVCDLCGSADHTRLLYIQRKTA